MVALTTCLAVALDRDIRPTRPAWRHAPRSAVLLAFGFVFMVESLARGEASRMVPIAQMGLALSAVAEFVFPHEPFSARKGMGLAAAVAALSVFAQL